MRPCLSRIIPHAAGLMAVMKTLAANDQAFLIEALGSDLVTRFERLGSELQCYDVFPDRLSENARADLCWRTAEKLCGGNKNRVKGPAVVQVPEWQQVRET